MSLMLRINELPSNSGNSVSSCGRLSSFRLQLRCSFLRFVSLFMSDGMCVMAWYDKFRCVREVSSKIGGGIP